MTVPPYTARAILVGAVLGGAWYAALLLPAFCREDLLGGGGRSPWRMLLLMVLASAVLTSVLPFERLNSRRSMRLVAGLLLPVAGAVVYAGSVLATDLLLDFPHFLSTLPEHPQGSVLGLFGLVSGYVTLFFVGVPAIAAVYLSSAAFVAFPLGVLHVELVTRLGSAWRRRAEAVPS